MKAQEFWGTDKEVLIIDLDGTICSDNSYPDYAQAKAFEIEINALKSLSEKYFIVFWTARYEADRSVTEDWLFRHGIRYDRLVFGKLPYDLFIEMNSCKSITELVNF